MKSNEEENNLDYEHDITVPPILDETFEVFSSQIRLSIMLILNTYQKVKVRQIQQAFNISSGKLEHHIGILEHEKLITKSPGIFPRRVQLVIQITPKGKETLQSYIDVMKDMFNNID